jgi:hypothetical protein
MHTVFCVVLFIVHQATEYSAAWFLNQKVVTLWTALKKLTTLNSSYSSLEKPFILTQNECQIWHQVLTQ